MKLVTGGSTLFIDASYDPSSASTPNPDVALTVDTRDRNALITHHHGDHFDAPALRTVLGETGILVVPESVAPFADTRTFRTQPAKLFEPVFLPRGSAAFVAISVPAVDGLGHPQVSWVVSAGAGGRCRASAAGGSRCRFTTEARATAISRSRMRPRDSSRRRRPRT